MIKKMPEIMIFTLGALVAAAMMIAASGRHAYDYYTIMRWLVTLICGLGLYISIKSGLKYAIWITGITAFVFNPIIPVHFRKATWNILDPIFAAMLLIAIILMWVDRRAG